MTTQEETSFPRGRRSQQQQQQQHRAPSSSSSASKQRREEDGTKARRRKRSTDDQDTSKQQQRRRRDNDFLFGSTTSTAAAETGKRKKRRKTTGDDASVPSSSTSQLPLGGGAVIQPTTAGSIHRPAFIESLSFAKLTKGMTILGAVREVSEEYAIVSLPTMLTGFVRREENGPPLTHVLTPNTMMTVSILRTATETVSSSSTKGGGGSSSSSPTTKRRIELAIQPRHVNAGLTMDDLQQQQRGNKGSKLTVRGTIVSVEDHGCLVDVVLHGNKGTCFLKFDNVEEEYELDGDDEDGEEDESDDEEEETGGAAEEEPMDVEEESKSKKGRKRGSSTSTEGKRILRPGRIYDFFVVPSAKGGGGSGGGGTGTGGIVQLSLPSRRSLSRNLTQPFLPSSSPSNPTAATTLEGGSGILSQQGHTLRSLRAGMLVKATVEHHAKNGMCVSFLNGVFRGAIDSNHLGGYPTPNMAKGWIGGGGGGTNGGKKDAHAGSYESGGWWRSIFRGAFRTVTARILAIDPVSRIVRLSLLPHVLHLKVPGLDDSSLPSLPSVGTVVRGARVIRLDPGVGALLALPSSSGRDDDDDEEEGKDGETAKDDEEMEEDASSTSDDDGDVFSDLRSVPEYRAASRVRCAYVHISKAMDLPSGGGGRSNHRKRTPEALFAKAFPVRSTVKTLRILSTSNHVDHVASCATAESIVTAHVLTHADVRPGTVYRSVPVAHLLDGGGVLVDLGLGIKGLIPASHLFDKGGFNAHDSSGYRHKTRLAKFKVGNKVDVRCLTVDPAAKRCTLTAKKSLIQTDVDEPVVDYASLVPHRVATGFVSRVDERGVVVTFYNNVHGRVSARSLAAELGVEDPKVNYALGDVVKARVVSCARRRGRHEEDDAEKEGDGEGGVEGGGGYHDLVLSLSTEIPPEEGAGADDNDDDAAATSEGTRVRMSAGSVLPPKCMKIVQLVDSRPRRDGLEGYIPGYAIVSIKSKHLQGSRRGGTVECKLPYDQILDSYGDDVVSSGQLMDELAHKNLRVGKKINQPGLVLSTSFRRDGLPVISLRPLLIETASNMAALSKQEKIAENSKIILPSPSTHLYMGAYIHGCVSRLDPRYGAFVRCLDGLTGLIPKLKKGLDESLYGTVLCKVVALDVTSSPPKILLKRSSLSEVNRKKKKKEKMSASAPAAVRIQPGDEVGDVTVADVNFARATVHLQDKKYGDAKIRARIHVTMGQSPAVVHGRKKKESKKRKGGGVKITKHHPFYGWKPGDTITDAKCMAIDIRDGVSYIELTNRPFSDADYNAAAVGSPDTSKSDGPPPIFVEDPAHLPPGTPVGAIITSVSSNALRSGIWVQVCPGIAGFIPGLELSTDPNVLNNLAEHYPVGDRITCCVMEKLGPKKKSWIPSRHRLDDDESHPGANKEHHVVYLSVLLLQQGAPVTSGKEKGNQPTKPLKPTRGDLVVGRINRNILGQRDPALMLNLRGGFVGRCCITELAEMDDWLNMPLGRMVHDATETKQGGGHKRTIVTDEEDVEDREKDDDIEGDHEEEDDASMEHQGDYLHGKYVQCRVLSGVKSKPLVEVSLRDSRLDGDLDYDNLPEAKEMVHAYVINTNRKGCFVRLSRFVEGRVILKELSDGFLPDPAGMFPMGRLVIGKVKEVKEVRRIEPSGKNKKPDQVRASVDMDLRESTLLGSQERLAFEDIEEQSKHKGTVTRVEPYGVFVRLDNSDISGLAHLSECSDKYIKNLAAMYDPGDLVKVLVIKVDKDQKRIGLSLKASNFEGDADSDDESSSDETSSDSSDSDEEMPDVVPSDDSDDDSKSFDSEDENYASKLASKMEGSGETGKDGDDVKEENSESDSSSEDSSDGEDGSSSDSSDEEEGDGKASQTMDTDVGFDWGVKVSSTTKNVNSSSDESDSPSDESDDEEDNTGKSSHKARKKTAAKRREEKEISLRESALADGTADDNPETAADFERILASDPNSSESWIKYMAYYLSLADIDSARNIANRAFDRIEFRQEGEKLNVWTALLTLELKYGSGKSLEETIDRACQHNNPKQVYLRVCEMLEREVDVSASGLDSNGKNEAASRADAMFAKMCKKFKSKKTVWIAHLKYLLKGGRHEEAHSLLKRSLTSLPAYKHVETMSKFAQLEFEHGSVERGRTIFDALLEKHPKRMDLLFVHVDKEVKNGEVEAARTLFQKVVKPSPDSGKRFKFSDKQMKSLFKKWYRLEEVHGDDTNRDHVKAEAKAFVERSVSNG